MQIKTAVVSVAFVGLCFQGGTVLAAWGDGPGCGLGKMLFDREPKSILMQHIGSTSNVPSQPFGISSGTSGCTNNGMIVKEEQATVFASLAFNDLSQEMAQGHGEHLVSLATVLGVPPDRQAEFFALVQDRYLSLMRTGESSPQDMVRALQSAMIRQPIRAEVFTNR